MENKRLIDANALNWGRCPTDGKLAKAWLDEAPTVDAVEVVHAYWEGNEPGDWHCSHCGEYAADGGFEQTKYCPNCGAKMDGDMNG